MSVNVLQVLWLSAVDVAGEVQVEVVLGVADLRERHHAGVVGDFELTRERVYDEVNILGA